MKREHTVINGAERMEECAEYIRSKFAAEGYEAQKLRIDDPKVKAMVVQIKNTKSKAGLLFKTAIGLDACATLKLQCDYDSNLQIAVANNRLGISAGAPFYVTNVIGFFKQKQLLDRIFMESISFFTAQK